MEIVVKVPLVYFHKVLLALNAVFRRFPKYTFEADGVTVNGRRTHQAVGKQVLEQMRRVTPLGHHHVIVVARHNAVGTRQAEVRTFIGKAQGSTTVGRERIELRQRAMVDIGNTPIHRQTVAHCISQLAIMKCYVAVTGNHAVPFGIMNDTTCHAQPLNDRV